MLSVIRIEEAEQDGLTLHYVFGLNILDANGIEVSPAHDPRVIFLQSLSRQVTCSAQIGNLYDFADDPEELFGLSVGRNAYTLSQVGVYAGTFYDAASWPTFPPCFFPQVTDGFWQSETPQADANIKLVISRDALALYVGPADDALEKMQTLVKEPFPGHAEWLRLTTNLYQLVILTSGDGWYFHIYGRKGSHFDQLSPAISEATKAVEATNWYQQHAASLLWDEEYGGCLRLPELIPKAK